MVDVVLSTSWIHYTNYKLDWILQQYSIQVDSTILTDCSANPISSFEKIKPPISTKNMEATKSRNSITNITKEDECSRESHISLTQESANGRGNQQQSNGAFEIQWQKIPFYFSTTKTTTTKALSNITQELQETTNATTTTMDLYKIARFPRILLPKIKKIATVSNLEIIAIVKLIPPQPAQIKQYKKSFCNNSKADHYLAA